MSTRYKNGSHYENHSREADLRDSAAHSHAVAELDGQQDHLSGHEQSQRAQEHSEDPREHSQTTTVGHGIAAFGHEEIAFLAHSLWVERGSPVGSPDDDWFHALELLRSRSFGH
jgi:hypothetical protein